MKAMIFAAGLGSRLRPLTDVIPKPLIPVSGAPVIEHTIGYLQRQGITDIVINIHHHADTIRRSLGSGGRLGVRITYSHESILLGTGGGLKKAESALAGGTFVLINSDIITETDLNDAIHFHRSSGACATMVLRRDPDAERYGAIRTDGDGRVRQILNYVPAPPGVPLQSFMFTGIHILEQSVFSYLPPREICSITEVMYPALLRAGETVAGYITEAYWADLGTQESYQRAVRDIGEGKGALFLLPRR